MQRRFCALEAASCVVALRCRLPQLVAARSNRWCRCRLRSLHWGTCFACMPLSSIGAYGRLRTLLPPMLCQPRRASKWWRQCLGCGDCAGVCWRLTSHCSRASGSRYMACRLHCACRRYLRLDAQIAASNGQQQVFHCSSFRATAAVQCRFLSNACLCLIIRHHLSLQLSDNAHGLPFDSLAFPPPFLVFYSHIHISRSGMSFASKDAPLSPPQCVAQFHSCLIQVSDLFFGWTCVFYLQANFRSMRSRLLDTYSESAADDICAPCKLFGSRNFWLEQNFSRNNFTYNITINPVSNPAFSGVYLHFKDILFLSFYSLPRLNTTNCSMSAMALARLCDKRKQHCLHNSVHMR